MTSRSRSAKGATVWTSSSPLDDRGGSSAPSSPETNKGLAWLGRAWPFLILVGAVAIVFGHVIRGGFAPIDDAMLVTNNPLFRPISLIHNLEPWRRPVDHLYIPVTYNFLALEAVVSSRISDLYGCFDPAVYHAGDVILHALNSCLVLIILRLLTANVGAALLGALLFALHPLQVESVAWISETKGLLGNFFCLSGLALQVGRFRWRHVSKAADRTLCAGMNLAFILALLSKPSTVTIVPIAWLIQVGLLRRSILWTSLELLPAAIAAVAISIVTKLTQADELLEFIPPLAMRPLIVGDAIAFYLGKLVMPFSLTVDYGRSPDFVLDTKWIWFAWLVPVGLAAGLALLPQRRVWLLSLAIFVIGFLPVSGLVSFVFQYYSTVSDRYVYLSMFGVSLAVAWLFTVQRRPLLIVAFSVSLCVLACLSIRQAMTWRSAETLYAHATNVTPNGYLTQSGLGNLYVDTGRHQEAIEHLTRAAALKPNFGNVHHKLGEALLGAGRADEAVEQFREVVRLMPDNTVARNDLGVALGKAGRSQEAIAEFEDVLEQHPDDVGTLANLVVAYARADRRADAIAAAQRARTLARAQRNVRLLMNIEGWLEKNGGQASQP
jgi:protein O-mannosyl-transferase